VELPPRSLHPSLRDTRRDFENKMPAAVGYENSRHRKEHRRRTPVFVPRRAIFFQTDPREHGRFSRRTLCRARGFVIAIPHDFYTPFYSLYARNAREAPPRGKATLVDEAAPRAAQLIFETFRYGKIRESKNTVGDDRGAATATRICGS